MGNKLRLLQDKQKELTSLNDMLSITPSKIAELTQSIENLKIELAEVDARLAEQSEEEARQLQEAV